MMEFRLRRTTISPRAICPFLLVAWLSSVPLAAGQDPAPPSQVPSDRAVNPAQPDFTIVTLPTTLRIPRFGSSFRVTHRFTRRLGEGSFKDLVSDFFGFDSGAQIGLEYRFGIMAGTQIGIHRTSDRTIQLFAQQQVLHQGQNFPLGVDVIATIEGTNNFRDRYMPGIGAVVSRTLGRHGAFYAHPIWIHDTNSVASSLDEDYTFLLGLGGRLRVRPSLYLVGEIVPRFGYEPGVDQYSFGIERRAGGHSFQLNFGNGFGTTMSQLAVGGITNDDLFIGFNISRKFF
jgi:uncharacterized beta barrel domain-containing protein DUF5777